LVFDKVLVPICSYLEGFQRNVLSIEFGRFHCSINISETKLVWSGTSAFTREFRKEFFLSGSTWIRRNLLKLRMLLSLSIIESLCMPNVGISIGGEVTVGTDPVTLFLQGIGLVT